MTAQAIMVAGGNVGGVTCSLKLLNIRGNVDLRVW